VNTITGFKGFWNMGGVFFAQTPLRFEVLGNLMGKENRVKGYPLAKTKVRGTKGGGLTKNKTPTPPPLLNPPCSRQSPKIFKKRLKKPFFFLGGGGEENPGHQTRKWGFFSVKE